MKQSRLMSFVESTANIAVGFGLGLLGQVVFLPLLGIDANLQQNLVFAAIMTVLSIVRSYSLRRVFEALRIRQQSLPSGGSHG